MRICTCPLALPAFIPTSKHASRSESSIMKPSRPAAPLPPDREARGGGKKKRIFYAWLAFLTPDIFHGCYFYLFAHLFSAFLEAREVTLAKYADILLTSALLCVCVSPTCMSVFFYIVLKINRRGVKRSRPVLFAFCFFPHCSSISEFLSPHYKTWAESNRSRPLCSPPPFPPHMRYIFEKWQLLPCAYRSALWDLRANAANERVHKSQPGRSSSSC